MKIARAKGIPVELWRNVEQYDFAGSKVHVEVLNPSLNSPPSDLNNESLALRIRYENHAFLLAADIGSDTEESLVLSDMPLSANVLKIPHHGSKNSNSRAFLRAVNPRLAVLTVGPGIQGLPSRDALDSYKQLGIPLLRTDRDGFIQICSDGNSLTCQTFRKSSGSKTNHVELLSGLSETSDSLGRTVGKIR